MLYKKALWLIESNYRDCVMIYLQRNDLLHSVGYHSSWRGFTCFLTKNHFKIIDLMNSQSIECLENGQYSSNRSHNSSSRLGGNGNVSASQNNSSTIHGNHNVQEISNMSIFYYPITSIVRKKEQQRSSRGLITEVLRAFCRNPFA